MLFRRKKSRNQVKPAEPTVKGWPEATLETCLKRMSKPGGTISVAVKSLKHSLSGDAGWYRLAKQESEMAKEMGELSERNLPEIFLNSEVFEVEGLWGSRFSKGKYQTYSFLALYQ